MLSQYELYLSYNPETDDLAASLEFLSKIVSNQSKADSMLIGGLEVGLTSKIVLENIQKSSIRIFVRNIIRNTKEEDIKDKGAIAFINQFLIEARKPFLDYASKHSTLESREDIDALKTQIVKIANTNNINSLPLEGLSEEHIANCLSTYSVPSGLGMQQSITAKCAGQEFQLNRNFKVTPERIQSLLNSGESVLPDQIVYLKPKMLVYKGDGKWDFQDKLGKTVKAKILDEDWLERFQKGQLNKETEFPYPQSVLKVCADITITYDETGHKKDELAYAIKKVYCRALPKDIPKGFFD